MGALEGALREERATLLRMIQTYEREIALTSFGNKEKRDEYLGYIKSAYEDLAIIEKAGIK